MSHSYILVFNKPYGVICQFSAHEKYPSLKDFINLPKYYPAGRLDTDSEGLLILTDNGTLQHQISHPKFQKEKTYFVQLEGKPNQQQLAILETRIPLKKFTTQAAKIRLLEESEIAKIWPRKPSIRLRKNIPDFWIAITLQEGKNRQVRRMTAYAGFPCLRLIRTQIGNLNLFELDLPIGHYKKINTQSL